MSIERDRDIEEYSPSDPPIMIPENRVIPQEIPRKVVMWKTGGREIPINEMEHSHLINCIKYLEKGAHSVPGSDIKIVSHKLYPDLVLEAIHRRLLPNDYNGVDCSLPRDNMPQVRGKIVVGVEKKERRIDLEL